MTDALRLMQEICAQPGPFRPYCAEPFTVPADDSEDALRAHLARSTFPIYHPVGTCAIGSVVDADLRAIGLGASASSMPR
jgi:choline dehydrogenase